MLLSSDALVTVASCYNLPKRNWIGGRMKNLKFLGVVPHPFNQHILIVLSQGTS